MTQKPVQKKNKKIEKKTAPKKAEASQSKKKYFRVADDAIILKFKQEHPIMPRGELVKTMVKTLKKSHQSVLERVKKYLSNLSQ